MLLSLEEQKKLFCGCDDNTKISERKILSTVLFNVCARCVGKTRIIITKNNEREVAAKEVVES